MDRNCCHEVHIGTRVLCGHHMFAALVAIAIELFGVMMSTFSTFSTRVTWCVFGVASLSNGSLFSLVNGFLIIFIVCTMFLFVHFNSIPTLRFGNQNMFHTFF